MSRPLLALLLAFALAAGLAACGGGGSSSSSTASTSAGPPATTPSTSTSTGPSATTPAAPAGAAKPSAAAVASETAADRRAAGRAAPFVKPEADNSVPTFGSEAAASDRAQAETTLKAYLQARAREDWASACAQLAKPTRQGYEKLAASSSKGKAVSCAQVLAALSKGADLSDPLTGALVSLRVHGQNAFALFYGPHHQQYMVPMNREAGEWKPTQAAAIAYPPGAAPTTSP
jgi:hypothetical protein